MKRYIASVLICVLILGLAACGSGGNAQSNNGLPAPAMSFSTARGDTVGTSPQSPVDGDYLYISVDGYEPYDRAARNTQGIFSVSVVFMGDTTATEYLDITGFTAYIDGEAQVFDADFMPGVYHGTENLTAYEILLPEPPPREDGVRVSAFPFQVAKIWFEAKINGSKVRSETHDWKEDGQMLRLGDASADPPLTLAAAGSSLSPVNGEIIQLGGIDWRILDVQDGRAFVLSEYLVNSGPIHSLPELPPGATPYSGPAVTWETSSLRSYLNGEFYNRFSEEEKGRILETPGISSYNPWHERNVGNVTTDKIFILSAEEVIHYLLGDRGQVEEKEGPLEGDLVYHAPGLTDLLNVRMTDNHGDRYDWWLRTVGSGEYILPGISGGTDFICVGSGFSESDSMDLSGTKLSGHTSGIRPAMWIRYDGEGSGAAPPAPGAASMPNAPEQVRQWEITLQLNNRDEPYIGVYSGEVMNGLPHGQGSFVTTNAVGAQRTYTGGWNAGHFNGEGRWEHRYNIIKFEGTFENDLMANGRMYDLSGQLCYEGEFRDGFRLEDEAARQARMDAYNATPFPSGGDYSQFVGQVVTVEREIQDVVPDGPAVLFTHFQPDGRTIAGVNYYPAYGETLPQPGSRIVWYYLVYEAGGSVMQDLVAWKPA